jgi:hypothetical protein
VVAVFSILIDGRYFGGLSTTMAAILFFAPLVCWLPELPPRLRDVGRIATIGVPVLIVVLLAKQLFDKESARSSTKAKGETSASYDYNASDYDSFKP